MSRDLSKGDIPTLILAVLAQGPYHGYALAREVEQRSQDIFRLREGSLYPALRALEGQGFIVGEWETGAHAPARKVYRITPQGHAELKRRVHDWTAYKNAIDRIVGGNGGVGGTRHASAH